MLKKPGPLIALRPRFPVVPADAERNALRLTQARLVELGAAGRLANGSPARSMRSYVSPSPFESVPARKLMGCPEWALKSALTCHPRVRSFHRVVSDGREY